jgi:hypothetical protein
MTIRFDLRKAHVAAGNAHSCWRSVGVRAYLLTANPVVNQPRLAQAHRVTRVKPTSTLAKSNRLTQR